MIQNLRDLGGIHTADGRKVRHGLIFRAGVINKLSPEDNQFLSRVNTVIDLRTPQEVLEKPDVLPEGIEYVHVPMFMEATLGITKETGADYGAYIKKTWNHKKIMSVLPDMTWIYQYVMTDKEIVARIGEAMHIVIRNAIEGKVTLFHCSQGKDRTGALAALLLDLLGTDRDTVFNDYHSLSRAMRGKALKDCILVTIFKLDPIAAVKVWQSYMASRRYIRSSFDTIDRLYGSSASLYRDHLSIPDSLRDSFRLAALTD